MRITATITIATTITIMTATRVPESGVPQVEPRWQVRGFGLKSPPQR